GYDWYGDVVDSAPAAAAAPGAFRRLLVNPVCERDFNEGCRACGGKGALLSKETMRLVRDALAAFPGAAAEVVCDKHGGRTRYATLLMETLQPACLVPEAETAGLSRYRLTLGGRDVAISFRAKADAHDPPAALASMAAKYVRELFMEALNRFFLGRLPGLRPTAGYYADGLRFLSEVEPLLGELRCDRGGFVRER
ncbi:MAG: hypothetical protein ACREID_01050, partial [Planctomycetota bacterium]